jgi:hypothetical protein
MRRQEKKVVFPVLYFCTIYMSYSQLKMRRTNTTLSYTYTAKTLYQKFEANVPRNETVPPCSRFLPLCISEQIYILTIGPPILLQQNRWTYPDIK